VKLPLLRVIDSNAVLAAVVAVGTTTTATATNQPTATFWPKFKKVKNKPKEYLYHAMPTGATPVRINPEIGCHTIGDWDFLYDGWYIDYLAEDDNEYHILHGMPMFCNGATRGNMFPNSCKGILSKDVLTHLGCTAAVMKDKDGFPDSLFFYQLLLPTCDTTKNDNDPCMSFYLDVSRFSNSYANVELGLGTGYGHKQLQGCPDS
jgi:hypothetical protein